MIVDRVLKRGEILEFFRQEHTFGEKLRWGPTHGCRAASGYQCNEVTPHQSWPSSLPRVRRIVGSHDSLRSALALIGLSCNSSIMLRRLTTSFFRIAVTRRTIATRLDHSVRLFSNLALRKPYPLLSKTPCKLAYIKTCNCCQFSHTFISTPRIRKGRK